MPSVPTEADWRSEPWDLDTPYAYDHFFGKTLREAVGLLAESAVYYHEDLLFMPSACLRYYIVAYIEYLSSERSFGDSGGASCFLSLIDCRCDDIRSFSRNTFQRTIKALKKMRVHQNRYNGSPEIYGDFATRIEQTLRLLNEPC